MRFHCGITNELARTAHIQQLDRDRHATARVADGPLVTDVPTMGARQTRGRM
jgi:hypothetical protein